jgi:hypothetical protein
VLGTVHELFYQFKDSPVWIELHGSIICQKLMLVKRLEPELQQCHSPANNTGVEKPGPIKRAIGPLMVRLVAVNTLYAIEAP